MERSDQILTDDDQEGDAGEGSSPSNAPQSKFNIIDSAGSAPQNEQLDIVYYKRNNLEESTGSSSKTLKDDVSIIHESVSVRNVQITRWGEATYVRKKVDDSGRFSARMVGIEVGSLVS